jgi:hypothetical protein
MPSPSIPDGRRSKRIATEKRLGFVINLGGVPRLLPCLIVDRSEEGFRLQGSFRLKRGQLVEVITEEDAPVDAVLCQVIWIGKAGSKQGGEMGLHTVRK